MDSLKKIFPISFKYSDTVANLIIGILLHLVVGIVFGVVIAIAGLIPLAIIGILLRLVSIVVDLYVVAGIVIEVLVFCKVLK